MMYNNENSTNLLQNQCNMPEKNAVDFVDQLSAGIEKLDTLIGSAERALSFSAQKTGNAMMFQSSTSKTEAASKNLALLKHCREVYLTVQNDLKSSLQSSAVVLN